MSTKHSSLHAYKSYRCFYHQYDISLKFILCLLTFTVTNNVPFWEKNHNALFDPVLFCNILKCKNNLLLYCLFLKCRQVAQNLPNFNSVPRNLLSVQKPMRVI